MRSLIVAVSVFFILSGMPFSLAGSGDPAPSRILLPDLIDADTEYGPGNYELGGATFIDIGATVTFKAGSRILVEPSIMNGFTVRGTLIFEGSSSNNVFIGSSASEKRPDDWYGITVNSPGALRFQYAEIGHARYGVLAYPGSTVDIDRCVIANCSWAGIDLYNFDIHGTMYFVEGAKVNNTIIKDNYRGIIDNGNFSTYYANRFYKNKHGALLLGEGMSPCSRGANIRSCIFEDNMRIALLLNGTDDPNMVTDMTVNGCTFRTPNVNGWRDIESFGRVRGLTIRSSIFPRGNNHHKIFLKGSEDAEIFYNTIYGSNAENYQEMILGATKFRNLTIRNNAFYGSDPYEGNTRVIYAEGGDGLSLSYNNIHQNSNNGIYIENCTDVSVDHNIIENGKYSITIRETIPTSLSGNEIRDARGTGISLVAGFLAREEGIPRIEGNHIDGAKIGIGLAAMEEVWIGPNVLNGTQTAFYISPQVVDCSVMIENATVTNCSRQVVHMEVYDINCTVTLFNTSFPHYNVELRGRVGYSCDLYISHLFKVGARNEMGVPIEFDLSVSNESEPGWVEGRFMGSTPLIQGPVYHFTSDQAYSYRIVDPNSTICYYTASSGTGSHEGMVNISGYREIELVLDQLPVQNMDEIHITEDHWKMLDPQALFSDLDEIHIEIVEHDPDLIFEGWMVKNAVENWTGSANATFRATDTMGNSTEGVVKFIVDPINDPPVIHPPLPVIVMDEDTSAWINLSMHIQDAEGDEVRVWLGEHHHISAILEEPHWNLTIIPDKDWYGTTRVNFSYQEVWYLEAEHEGGIIPPYHGHLMVEVLPVNDPPEFTVPEDWNITVERGKLVEIDLSPYVHDVDDETLLLSTNHEHASITGTLLRILFPAGSIHNMATLTITAEDPQGAKAFAQLSVYVTDPDIPSPEWKITSAGVILDEDGNWIVDVSGTPNSTVFIIVAGVGSFRLEESGDVPGQYGITLSFLSFKLGSTYSYHFSDRQNGQDLAPGFSGSVEQPKEEVVIGERSPLVEYLVFGACCGAVILLMLIVLAFLALRRKGSEEEE